MTRAGARGSMAGILDGARRCLGARHEAVVAGRVADGWRADSITEAAASLRVGNGLDEGVQMGPVITPQSKTRVESLVGQSGALLLSLLTVQALDQVEDYLIVAAITDGGIYLALSSNDGVQLGDRFEVRQINNEVFDPQTKETIALEAVKVGEVIIKEVDNKSSLGDYGGQALNPTYITGKGYQVRLMNR